MTFQSIPIPAAFPSLAEIAIDLRSGKTSSLDLTRECLQRIARFDPELNCFISVFKTEALEAAAKADGELASGVDKGPLHGIPVALKDLFDMQGKATTAGSPLLLENVAKQDAEVVERLRRSGAVIVGKTHLVQFALGSWGTNQHMATPRNPRGSTETTLVPGGSSSGSTVAVAANLVPWALGTDTGGSVRVPAAFCGIVGFKPTIDALPRQGVFALSQSLDSVGILTRSIDDARICFETLREEQRVPASAPQWAKRVGHLLPQELLALQPDVARAYADNLAQLKSAGYTLVPFEFPVAIEAFKSVTNAIMITEGAAANARFLVDENAPIDSSVRPRLVAASATLAVDYLHAQSTAAEWKIQFAEAMNRLEIAAVVMPTTACTAPRIEDVDHSQAPVHFTRPMNLLALCALSLPASFDANSRPIGLQVVGRAWDDSRLLAVAASMENVVRPVNSTPEEVVDA
jgi:aspartyl-tRNA(Asn)/glutamyl-tRNA(Gln) amidotransferase subunit A